ncbi:MAG TPA: hypothetical protein VIV60_27895, partial [Polyangiaceae bacterium]
SVCGRVAPSIGGAGMKAARWGRRVAPLAILLALTSPLVVSGSVAAAPSSIAETATDAPPRVDIVVVGSTSLAEAVEARVASWFQGHNTALRAHTASTLTVRDVRSARAEVGVTVWLMVRAPASAILYFTVTNSDGAPSRYLVEEVSLVGGFDELGLEHVGQVIYLSALALWSGTAQSTAKEVDESLAVVTGKPLIDVPPSSQAENWRAPRSADLAVIGVDYRLRSAGPEGLTQGPGVVLACRRATGPFAFGGVASIGLLLRQSGRANGVEVELHGARFGLGALVRRSLSARLAATASLGFEFDSVRYQSASFGERSVLALESRTEVRPFVDMSAGACLAFTPLDACLAVATNVALVRTHYDLLEHGEPSELFAPWIVQPGLSASLNW